MTVAAAALFDALCESLRIRLPADELDSMYVWTCAVVSSGALACQPQPVLDLEHTLVCECATGERLRCSMHQLLCVAVVIDRAHPVSVGFHGQ
jgi:hypothetical protein